MRASILIALLLACTAAVANSQDNPIPKDSPQYGQWETGAGLEGEPVGGQPPKGAKPSITDFEYELCLFGEPAMNS